jgi:8-oxo-dGTP pyrophosphatase MutT (NUDIX family)
MISHSTVFQRLQARLPLHRREWSSDLDAVSRPQAAVLVTLTDSPQPEVLLGRRAMHLPLHPGEVAFPGGKREVEDPSPWATAIREAVEEVGLDAQLVSPLGELPPLVTRTGFEVHPCIARVPARLALVVDPGEFDSLFRLQLDTFADPGLFRLEAMSDGERTRMVPHYQIEGDNIWGVTAAVLAQLANVAYDAGLDLQRDWKLTP